MARDTTDSEEEDKSKEPVGVDTLAYRVGQFVDMDYFEGFKKGIKQDFAALKEEMIRHYLKVTEVNVDRETLMKNEMREMVDGLEMSWNRTIQRGLLYGSVIVVLSWFLTFVF